MLRTGTRSSRLALLVVVAGLGLAACGGGSSDSSADTTTTTPAPEGALDPSATDAAKAAGVTLPDLGADWTQFRKAGGFVSATDEACITDFGSGIAETDEFYSGPMFQDTSETAFVYTYSYVFRTERAAQAFTAVARTEDFTKCKEAADDAAQKKRDPKTFVRVTATTDPAVGSGGLEAYYVETPGGTNPDGTESESGSYSRYYYRSGRVVYVILLDTGSVPDAATAETLQNRTAKAVADVKAAIESRLQALDV